VCVHPYLEPSTRLVKATVQEGRSVLYHCTLRQSVSTWSQRGVFPQQFVPLDSKPLVPKVLANCGRLQLQTACDRSSGRGFSHVEPAAKQPAARCFSAGETLRNSETSLLTPQTRQFACPIHRPPRTISNCHKTGTDRKANLVVSDRADKQRVFEKEICEKESKTHFPVSLKYNQQDATSK